MKTIKNYGPPYCEVPNPVSTWISSYGLDLKYPPKVHVLKGWLSVAALKKKIVPVGRRIDPKGFQSLASCSKAVETSGGGIVGGAGH